MRSTKILWVLVIALSLAASAWARGEPAQPNQNWSNQQSQNGGTSCPNLNLLDPEEPSAEEVRWLTLMRQEEKLARDVYTVLYEKWGVLAFDNISLSEQRHFDAIGLLLDRYKLDDPAADETVGVFANPEIALLFTNLTAQGATSLVEAFRVGTGIEELDIRDLMLASAATDNLDILRIYGNLLNGSISHLRAFMSHLQALGATYTPQYLDEDTFHLLLAGARKSGNGSGLGAQHRLGRR